MYKIKIFSIGKTKEPWLLEALSEYEKRLSPHMVIEWVLAKDNDQLTAFLGKESPPIVLSVDAKQLTSEEFSKTIFSTLEKLGSRLSFVIGGAEGIPPQILTKALTTISFSKLTFTHQMIRLILLEQLYRASEIQKGSGYHK